MDGKARNLLTRKPAPPPEASLIRIARKAAGMQIAQAAAIARGNAPSLRLSTVRWSQVELGYETKPGGFAAVVASDLVLAHMAAVTGITPERLTAAGREDAAEVLREILLQRQPPGSPLDRIAGDPDLSPDLKEAFLALARDMARNQGEDSREGNSNETSGPG